MLLRSEFCSFGMAKGVASEAAECVICAPSEI